MQVSEARVPQILLVEDDLSHARLIRASLQKIGSELDHVTTQADAIGKLGQRSYDLLLLDMKLPDGNGFEVQDWMRDRELATSIIFVTADDLAEHAVHAIQSGAAHYVVKRPNYLSQMIETVTQVLESRSSSGEAAAGAVLADQGEISTGRSSPTNEAVLTDAESGRWGLLGSSVLMQDVRRLIEKTGPLEHTVLITGETGTGKELAARAIHCASTRARMPFVPVNCAAIADSLFESELFGSTRGAFTGAVREREGLFGAASGGTLFLDEIGELPLAVQAKLLRVLEEKTYRKVGSSSERSSDTRIIAATHRDLSFASQRGGFRMDLYFRLNVLRIHLPSLAERPDDIPVLLDRFLRLDAKGEVPMVSQRAMRQLKRHTWPGNVRELKNAASKAMLWNQGETIEQFDLVSSELPGFDLQNRRGISRAQLTELLQQHEGRLELVASALGMSTRTVQRRIRELRIRIREYRRPGGRTN